MNKEKTLVYLLFALTILYPAGAVLTACFGYRFELISVSAFAIVIAALSVCMVVLDRIGKSTHENKATRVLLAMITPLSLINAAFFINKCPQIWVILSVFTSADCCCYLAIKYGKPLPLKTIALGLSVLTILPIAVFSFFAFIFENFGKITVVQTVESPCGTYYAQVIDHDQGALGGATRVNVYEKPKLNVILFRIESNPQKVYVGRWGEFKTMQIHWKDDHCLVINSVEYEIES